MDLSPFAGRWVAITGGQVVAQGLTADQARAAAQNSRPREQTLILYVSGRPELSFPPVFDRVRALCPPELPVWLVGGSVRDALLRLPIHDLDFAVHGDALRLAREVANRLNAAYYPLDAERGTGRVILREEGETFVLDFAALRGADLQADLASRDFTINAIALSLSDPETVLDPLNGEADLRARLLRVCSATAFRDDPARALRAVRLAAQFDLHIERNTREAARAVAPALEEVSPERIRDEFLRMLGGRRPASAIRATDRLGLLNHILPELASLKGVTQSPPHTLDVWEHTLAVLDRLNALYSVLGPVHNPDAAADLILGLAAVKLGRYRQNLHQHLKQTLSSDRPARSLLNLAALLHDARKPQTRTVEESGRIRFFGHDEQGAALASEVGERLRLSADEARRLRAVVAHHMRPLLLLQQNGLTRRAIFRFFRDTGEAGVDICLLSLADMLATYGPTLDQKTWVEMLELVAALLDARFREPERIVSPLPLLDGHDLMTEFGLSPGPQIGALLEAIREAQAAGEVKDRERAVALAREMLGASTRDS